MDTHQSLFSLHIDPSSKVHLSEAAKWARFLAIAGMVLLGLGFLFSVLTLTVLSNMDNTIFETGGGNAGELGTAFAASYMVGMLLFLLMAFFPLLFLLQFANRLRAALASNQQEELTAAFLNLKKYFRFVGIVLIIVLAIYGVAFVVGLMVNLGS